MSSEMRGGLGEGWDFLDAMMMALETLDDVYRRCCHHLW